MKRPRHFLHRKPRPKGWKDVPRQMCSTRDRQERERVGICGPKRGRGYLLANCLILAAAVIGTRKAYQSAMAQMGAAKDVDAWRFA